MASDEDVEVTIAAMAEQHMPMQLPTQLPRARPGIGSTGIATAAYAAIATLQPDSKLLKTTAEALSADANGNSLQQEDSFATAQQGPASDATGLTPPKARQRMTWQQSVAKQRNQQGLPFHYYPNLPRTSEDCNAEDQQAAKVRQAAAAFMSAASFKSFKSQDAYARETPSAPVQPWDQVPWGDSGDEGYPRDSIPVGKDTTSTVVHMSRTDAWARFSAYEACIQVCCQHMSHDSAQHFMSGGFQPLRDNLSIGGLLLSSQQQSVGGARSAEGSTPDICWRDETVDRDAVKLVVLPGADSNSSAAASGPASDTVVRVRVGGVILPGQNILQRLHRWAVKHQPVGQGPRKVAERQKKLVVYMNCPDGSNMLQCPVDRHGCPIIPAQYSWVPLSHMTGEMKLDVHAREGRLACGAVTADQLMQVAQSADIQDCPLDLPAWGQDSLEAVPTVSRLTKTINVSLLASNTSQSAGQLIIEVQRVKRSQIELEQEMMEAAAKNEGLSVTARGFGTLQSDLCMGKAGQSMLRMNRNIAYDYLLRAALEVEKCGPTRLTIEGPWQWLLTAYADQFNVSNPYRVLVHLQWILQPNIARTSQVCLSTICDSWRYLLTCKGKGELGPHEDTLLTRIRRDVEELLKVAFTRYYVPQPTEDCDADADDPPRQYQLQSWDATHLQAAVLLYNEVAPFLQPNAHDWLAQCWQTAAQKRWKALMAIGDPDRVLANEIGFEQANEPNSAGSLTTNLRRRAGNNSNTIATATTTSIRNVGEAKVYQLVMNLCKLIQEDMTFDLHLKREPGLLPDEPELPRKTAEEYLAQFLVILRLVLDVFPPTSPTPQAVDLLVAVASMQRYLDVAGLQCDKQHPGHLNAFQLFQPHVLRWISASQQRLIQQCQQLENGAKVANGSSLVLGPGNSCPLVLTMINAVGKELRCYERVIQHWPRFTPPLEAAMCQVMRSVLAALSRQCELVKGNAQTPQIMPSTVPAGPTHQRSATVGAGLGGGRYSPPLIGRGPGNVGNNMHRRNASVAVGNPTAAVLDGGEVGPLTMRAPGGKPTLLLSPRKNAANNDLKAQKQVETATPAVLSMPRMIILLKEAVLLNSLKHIMVMVPEMEDSLTQWATWSAGQTPLTSEGQMLPDGVDIGVHFAQLVKELRTDYATAVATCAGRLAETLRNTRHTNIREALRPSNGAGALGASPNQQPTYNQISTAATQRQALEEALAPVLAGISDAVAALQAALDTRVCVATGRALWDYVGKDLHLLVSGLQETNLESGDGGQAASAWRIRQNADASANRIDELFCSLFTEILNGAVQPCDLQPPAHMDKVHKLLQRNNAAINMAFTPF